MVISIVVVCSERIVREGEGELLIKCNISCCILEVVGEVWQGILLCKLYRIVMSLVGW